MDANNNAKQQGQIDEIELRVEQIYESTKRTERYMRWTFWVTIVVIGLPLVAALFIIPAALSQVTDMYSGLGL